MRSNLAPDSPSVRIRLATVTGAARGNSVLSARGGAKDAPILSSLVTLPDSRVVLKAPQDGSTTRMPPMLRRRNCWSPDQRHG
jgi:hypothetical protein